MNSSNMLGRLAPTKQVGNWDAEDLEFEQDGQVKYRGATLGHIACVGQIDCDFTRWVKRQFKQTLQAYS